MTNRIETRRAWQKEHAKELAAAAAERRRADPERHREIARKSYWKNRERHRQRDKERWEKYKGRLQEYNKKIREENPQYFLHASAKRRAKIKGLPFDIEVTDVIVPPFCPVLGIPIFVGSGKQGQNSPTIDRIDNARGYEKGNILVVSWRANQLKSDASLEELQTLANYYRRYL